MNVTDMTKAVYSIMGLPPAGTPKLNPAMVLLYLQEAHAIIAERSSCYRRRHIITPIIQAKATGSITIVSGNVTDGDTVTVNSIVYTFKNTVVLPFQVLISVGNVLTAENLSNAINGSTTNGACISGTFTNPYVIGSVSTNVVTLTAREYGTEANGFTLTENTTTARITLSGALFTGGVEGRFYNLPADYSSMNYVAYGTWEIQSSTAVNNSIEKGTPDYWFNHGSGKIGLDIPPDGRNGIAIDYNVVPFTSTDPKYPTLFPVLAIGADEPTNIPDRFCYMFVYFVVIKAIGGNLADAADGNQMRMSMAQSEYNRIITKFLESMAT